MNICRGPSSMKSASWQCWQTSALILESSLVLAIANAVVPIHFTGSLLARRGANCQVQDVRAVL